MLHNQLLSRKWKQQDSSNSHSSSSIEEVSTNESSFSRPFSLLRKHRPNVDRFPSAGSNESGLFSRLLRSLRGARDSGGVGGHRSSSARTQRSGRNQRILGLLAALLFLYLYSQRNVFRRMRRRYLKRIHAEERQRKWDSMIQTNARHVQQLAVVYQEIVAMLNTSASSSSHANASATSSRLPRLHQSFLSRPPYNVTHPTTVSHSMPAPKKLNWTTPMMTFSCSLQTQPRHAWSMARIIVFQRNGAKQLAAYMTHYLRVLPPDALVIVDHESDNNSSTRRTLLPHYAALGVHVWYCTGDYEHGRPSMWSMVTSVYQWDSAYVIPTDVDELLTVLVDTTDGPSTTTDSAARNPDNFLPLSLSSFPLETPERRHNLGLAWDTTRLYLALADLTVAATPTLKDGNVDNLGASLGYKPIKMYNSEPLPGDCPQLPQSSSAAASAASASPMCALQYTPFDSQRLPVSCMHKCLARGMDFVETDLGNHHLITTWTVDRAARQQKEFDLQKKWYQRYQQCEIEGVDAWYDRSSLLLLHLQKLQFADWMMHYMRGASMHGYTTGNCTGQEVASHYCAQWQEFQRYNFSLDSLQTIYQGRYCPSPHAQLDQDPNMLPIAHVFAHGCGGGCS